MTRGFRSEDLLDNQEVDALLRALAHELRSPLNALNGWFEIVRQSELRSAAVSPRALDGIARAIADQTELLRSLDGLAGPNRLERGANRLQDLSECLRRAAAALGTDTGDIFIGLDTLPAVEATFNDALQSACHVLARYLESCTLSVQIGLSAGASPIGVALAATDHCADNAALLALSPSVRLTDLKDRPRHLLSCWRTRRALADAAIRVRAINAHSIALEFRQ
ncbi:MAG: hypothetical protein R3E83_15425 [Burkholderiaceae bacterium]